MGKLNSVAPDSISVGKLFSAYTGILFSGLGRRRRYEDIIYITGHRCGSWALGAGEFPVCIIASRGDISSRVKPEEYI